VFRLRGADFVSVSVSGDRLSIRLKAGRGSLTWNGKTKRELPARKGPYKITIQAASPAGASARETATLHIT
jgi:hypothetical protein